MRREVVLTPCNGATPEESRIWEIRTCGSRRGRRSKDLLLLYDKNGGWIADLWSEIKSKTSKFKSEDIKKNPAVQEEVAKIVFDVITRENIKHKVGVFNLSDILKIKTADCVGFSQIYWIICSKLGIDVGIVPIYKNKHGEYLSDVESHVCNVLELSNGEEILVDLAYEEFNIKHQEIGNKLMDEEGIYSLVLTNLGDLLGNLNRFDDAEKKYRESLKINPNDAIAHNNLGNLLKDLNRFDDAEKELREAIRINPKFSVAHGNLGALLKILNRFDDAEKEHREAIKINPDFAPAHTNLGNLLRDLNRFDDAEKEHREAIKINPDFADAHNNLGVLLDDLNRFEEAEKEYRESIRINPNFAVAHGNLGLRLWQTIRKREAEEHFNKLLELRPDMSGWVENIKRSY